MSLTWYEHMTYRVITMFRGSLIHIIYGKTLRLDARAVLDAEAITLISADIDRISLGMQTMHDSYASVIELSLSLWLLSNLLGIAVVPPTIFIACKCSLFPIIRFHTMKPLISLQCVLRLEFPLPLRLGMHKCRGSRLSRNAWL